MTRRREPANGHDQPYSARSIPCDVGVLVLPSTWAVGRSSPHESAADLLARTTSHPMSPQRWNLEALGVSLVALAVIGLPAMVVAQETPLYRAAVAGYKQCVARLLAEGADVNARNNTGSTALHGAAREGHAKVVKLLLAKGADVNAKNGAEVTPLILAARGSHIPPGDSRCDPRLPFPCCRSSSSPARQLHRRSPMRPRR